MFKTPKNVLALVPIMALFCVVGCTEQASAPPKSAAASAPASPAVTPPELVGAWYQVYFDTDTTAIDLRGQQIVKNVAYVVANTGTTRVTVIGKSDSVGSQAANMALSKKRADKVRDALITAGVPAARIDTRWTGEGKLDVATGNGADQQLNRVVDVIVVKQ